MVDCSLPINDMIKLHGMCNFIWIDHHESIINEAAGKNFNGLQKIGLAGCELCWKYFNPNIDEPLIVHLLGRYDVWDHGDYRVLPFQYGIRGIHTHPETNLHFWNHMLYEPADLSKQTLSMILHEGTIIKKYVDEENTKTMETMAFETRFTDKTLSELRVLACNRQGNSQMFDSKWDPTKHDVMVPFFWNKKGYWQVSIFSTKPDINCAEIAKFYNGGGHRGAAGFIWKLSNLPFYILLK